MTTSMSLLLERPISRASALVRDQVADYLRESITTLRLPAGTPLIEREICEATTASRTTVREALRYLEAEGLVELDPGRGLIVKRLSLKEVEDLYAVRAQLEGLTCKLFTQNSSAQQRVRLRESFDEMVAVVDDPVLMLGKKDRFYDVLFEGSNNSELQHVLLRLRRRIKLFQANSLAAPGRPARSLSEIEGILVAIENGDSELAQSRCIAHIEAAAAVLESAQAKID